MLNSLFEMNLIVAIVERGKAEEIVAAAKEVGATGATILSGRGTGESEVKRFLKVNVENSKEIIFVLSEESKLKQIMKTMIKAGDICDPGTGIIFTIPIENLVGLRHRELF